MTSFTASVLAEFEKNIDIDLEYGLAEIKAILSTAYKTMKEANAPAKKLSANGEVKAKKERVKRDRDADGNIIKKRAPSAYNIYYNLRQISLAYSSNYHNFHQMIYLFSHLYSLYDHEVPHPLF